MKLLAIDPGSELSGYVVYDMRTGHPTFWDKIENERLRVVLGTAQARKIDHCCIEMISSYGKAVGQTTFTTCVWVGRFQESFQGELPALVYRPDVKLHLCGQRHAKDGEVRMALIDRYGPGKEKAVGLKASPGPLYGMKADCWQALALAVAYAETCPQFN